MYFCFLRCHLVASSYVIIVIYLISRYRKSTQNSWISFTLANNRWILDINDVKIHTKQGWHNPKNRVGVKVKFSPAIYFLWNALFSRVSLCYSYYSLLRWNMRWYHFETKKNSSKWLSSNLSVSLMQYREVFASVQVGIMIKFNYTKEVIMGAYKDKNGTWFASARYKNWAGETMCLSS